MTRDQIVIEAIGNFKDWSNFLLVTTVAAMGWIASNNVVFMHNMQKSLAIYSLVLSIVFGIFTLAMIPIITQLVTESTNSFYELSGKFKLFYLWGPTISMPVKAFCWWQHLLFIVGITTYAFGVKK